MATFDPATVKYTAAALDKALDIREALAALPGTDLQRWRIRDRRGATAAPEWRRRVWPLPSERSQHLDIALPDPCTAT